MSWAITIFVDHGLASARPAANACPTKHNGWFATDTGVLSISDGTSWIDIGGPGVAPVSSVFSRTGAVTAQSGDYTAAQVTNAADKGSGSAQAFTGNVQAPALIAAGLTGSVAASRYVGATASGAPASGAHLVGDYVVAQDGHMFVCTAAGTPGTWVDIGGSGAVSSVFSRSGAVVAVAGDYYGVVAAALTGATQASRYVGSTTSGAPVSGTFAVGDFVVAHDGNLWICTVAGSPGTWANAGSAGSLVNSVFGRTGSVVATSGDYDYSKIGNSANAIAVSNIAAGTAGQVLGGTGPGYSYPPGYEFDYVQITSPVSTTSTTTAITGNAVTYDGSTRVKIEFSAPRIVIVNNTECAVHLYEGSTDLGILTHLYGNSTAEIDAPCYGAVFLTPTAAAHTYLIKLTRATGSGTAEITAGAGGAGTDYPAWYRITKA